MRKFPSSTYQKIQLSFAGYPPRKLKLVLSHSLKFIKFKQKKIMTGLVLEYLISTIIIQCRFLQFYFSIFSLVLLSIEKIYQTLQTVFPTFPNISKFMQKTPLPFVFSTIFSVLKDVTKNCQSCFTINLEGSLTGLPW